MILDTMVIERYVRVITTQSHNISLFHLTISSLVSVIHSIMGQRSEQDNRGCSYQLALVILLLILWQLANEYHWWW